MTDCPPPEKQTPPRPQEVCCPRCGALFGRDTSEEFVPAGCAFAIRTDFNLRCLNCAYYRRWTKARGLGLRPGAAEGRDS